MADLGRRAALGVAVLAASALTAATSAWAGPAVATTTPFMYTGMNPCAVEGFTGDGKLHTTASENLSASGNIEFHLYARLDGLKAVTAMGKKYVVQETFAWDFTISKASEETFQVVAHFVRVGDDGSFVLGDDFYETIRAHITANANGVITATHVTMSDAEDPCR